MKTNTQIRNEIIENCKDCIVSFSDMRDSRVRDVIEWCHTKFPKSKKCDELYLYVLWEEYSRSMAAGWMIPDDASIQSVYGRYFE